MQREDEWMMRIAMEQDGTEGSRLGELFQRHAADGVRLAYLITGNRGLAEDLVQDAFVRLAGRLVHLRDPHNLEPYLRRTIVNLANAHFRRRKVERRYLEREAALPEVAQAGPDASEREMVWAVLRSLPVRQRTAILLHFFEDLSEVQTAQAMGCRPGTVKSLVSRGMDKLRPVMAVKAGE
jgi:RNA polymerase sigma-70 factor (sigma-E family)